MEVYGTTRLRLAVHMSRGRGRKVGFELVCKVPLVRHIVEESSSALKPSALTASHQAEKGGEKERELC